MDLYAHISSFPGLGRKPRTLFPNHVRGLLLGTEDNHFYHFEDFYVAPKNGLLAKKSQKSNSVLPAQCLLIEITVLQIGQTSVCRWTPCRDRKAFSRAG